MEQTHNRVSSRGNLANKVKFAISNNKLSISLSLIACVLVTNIGFWGFALAIPFISIVLCRTTFVGIKAFTFKVGFMLLLLVAWSLTHISNPIGYPIIGDTVMIDVNGLKYITPTTNRFQPDDNFVLLVNRYDDAKGKRITPEWIEFSVDHIKISHPEFGTSVRASLTPIHSRLDKSIDYILFDHYLAELKSAGVMKIERSQVLPWWSIVI
ncbi:hypothetical protein [Photobacterium leiognathi]|uniref:hypothetical protein n=1 Tax=Photobacterium leiognathi TaxID=553611 RepID=UPI00273870B9|nr:hypothetical protein [Photobacterium leiognathi]